MSCPLYLTLALTPPPIFFFFFGFLKNLLRLKINILSSIYPEINFPAEPVMKINNLSRPKVPAPPPSESNGRPLRRFIYKFLNVCPFDNTAVAGSGKVGPVNHTSWVAVVTPTDRPKSVCNRCVIELFVVLFVFSLCPFDISAGVGAFVIGLSQISPFFSY